MLLNHQPTESAALEGLDQRKERVGVVGQMHFRQREAPHPLQRLIAGQGGELVLPGLDLKQEIRDGG